MFGQRLLASCDQVAVLLFGSAGLDLDSPEAHETETGLFGDAVDQLSLTHAAH